MINFPSNMVFYQLTIDYKFYRMSYEEIKALIVKKIHKGKSNNELDINMKLKNKMKKKSMS